jgi:ABC-2 type transport system ATP-binding protein
MEPVIELVGVSKKFRVRFNPNPCIKSKFIGLFKQRYREKVSDFWALRDIHLRVMPGESVGIIGPNGSGKSTLFKLIAGIMPPTEGVLRTSGRIAPLIELGVGFHPELTGRENVFLNTSFYGFRRRDTERLLERIVDFSELHEFINVPLKNYSSGMAMRLGFAIAVHTAPDILLIDEILAVGDDHFQRKCFDRMVQFQREGKTFIFVSHALGAVVQMCPRTLLLWEGRVVAEGPSGEVVAEYGRRVSAMEARPARSVSEVKA